MPGSSLWLLPPKGHLNDVLASLIKTTSAHFNSEHLFIPHVTMTSEISPSCYSGNPQAWLEKIPFPTGEDLHVKFEELQTEKPFFRKLTIKVDKNEGIVGLGKVARETVEGFTEDQQAEKWAKETYAPHLSLLYSDVDVADEQMKEIEAEAAKAGVKLDGKGNMEGWNGGRVVLVPTDAEIKDWVPIAERML